MSEAVSSNFHGIASWGHIGAVIDGYKEAAEGLRASLRELVAIAQRLPRERSPTR